MTFDSKRKKAKAAKSTPASTAKDPKADAKKPTAATAMRGLPRKRAADFLSSDEEGEKAWAGIEGESRGKSKGKKSSAVSRKKAKKEEKPEEPAPSPKESSKDEGVSPSVAGGSGNADSQDEGADDQTAMLLKGFESSDEEEEEREDTDGTKFKNAKVPKHKEARKPGALVGREKTTPGIIYVGRIPHGFYEHEMRSYFSQFGEVTRLRLSRNKKTGHSKHYAFIEFADSDVAKIVTETMDNYLMFGHILKCKIVPRLDPEAVERLFIGANRRFKPRPGAKLQKAMLEKKKTKEGWDRKGELENKKRKRINRRLREKGIDYEFDIPEVKAPALVLDAPVEDIQAETPSARNTDVAVASQETHDKIADSPGDTQRNDSLDGSATVSEVVKKAKKSKKRKASKA